MYGQQPKELSIESITKKVSEWDLWRYYIPGVQLKRSFKSPLRKDENPSASLFLATDGRVLLKDFQIGTFNIWQFLQAKFNLTFIEALKVVDNDFDLGLCAKPLAEKPTMEFIGICTGENLETREETKLPVKKRTWNKADERYWGQFGLKVDFLQKHKIVPLQNYWVNDKLVYWYTPYDPAYSTEFGNGIRKIYRPLAKRFKWVTNAKNSHVQGDEFLAEKGDMLIITKSYKDVLLLKTLGYEAVASQSESTFLPEDKLEDYKNRFLKICLLWDNDTTGMNYSQKFCTLYCLIPIFVPDGSGTKDISDYYRMFGKDKTRELLQIITDGIKEREEGEEDYQVKAVE
jgi:hypothetical protein